MEENKVYVIAFMVAIVGIFALCFVLYDFQKAVINGLAGNIMFLAVMIVSQMVRIYGEKNAY